MRIRGGDLKYIYVKELLITAMGAICDWGIRRQLAPLGQKQGDRFRMRRWEVELIEASGEMGRRGEGGRMEDIVKKFDSISLLYREKANGRLGGSWRYRKEKTTDGPTERPRGAAAGRQNHCRGG